MYTVVGVLDGTGTADNVPLVAADIASQPANRQALWRQQENQVSKKHRSSHQHWLRFNVCCWVIDELIIDQDIDVIRLNNVNCSLSCTCCRRDVKSSPLERGAWSKRSSPTPAPRCRLNLMPSTARKRTPAKIRVLFTPRTNTWRSGRPSERRLVRCSTRSRWRDSRHGSLPLRNAMQHRNLGRSRAGKPGISGQWLLR